MDKDLAAVTAVWRALFGVRNRRFCCLFVYLSFLFQRAAEDVLWRIMGSVSGDGRDFRCSTVGELLRDWDCVSVMRVQEMCDEKRQVVRLGNRS
jgi:hypothetical protein